MEEVPYKGQIYFIREQYSHSVKEAYEGINWPYVRPARKNPNRFITDDRLGRLVQEHDRCKPPKHLEQHSHKLVGP